MKLDNRSNTLQTIVVVELGLLCRPEVYVCVRLLSLVQRERAKGRSSSRVRAGYWKTLCEMGKLSGRDEGVQIETGHL